MKKSIVIFFVGILLAMACTNAQNKPTLVSKQNVKYIVNGGKTPAPIGAVSIILENAGVSIRSIDVAFNTDTIDLNNNVKQVRLIDNDGVFIENRQENYPWFNLLFEHHYGTEFICVGITKNYYKILVNDQGQTYWVRKSPLLQFETLDKYFKNLVGIKIARNQHIRLKLEVNAPVITYSDNLRHQTFKVVQIKGDWMEIKSFDEDDEINSYQKLKSGWIRWRIGNSILINIIDSM